MSSYLQNIHRIVSSNFVPTDQDILRINVKTTCVTENILFSNGIAYRIYDVGGHQAERRKWIRCFNDVDVVIFCVDSAGYDLGTVEDQSMTSMREALGIFSYICDSRPLTKTSIILFFTKTELLERKLAISSFKRYFSHFKGDETDYIEVRYYITKQFLALNKQAGRKITVCFGDIVSDPSFGMLAFTSLKELIESR